MKDLWLEAYEDARPEDGSDPSTEAVQSLFQDRMERQIDAAMHREDR